MIKYGDLQLIENGENYLVIACDSAGSIGNKPEDVVQVSPETVGYYTAIVPVVEMLAARGEILSLVDTLSVEMVPTGEKIIDGIHRLMKQIDLPTDLLTGSTEENMSTSMTGIGVTVVGRLDRKVHESKKLVKGQVLVMIGYPKLGNDFLQDEVIGHKHECVTVKDMMNMKDMIEIKDMIPVGSKGAAYECSVLAHRYGLKVECASSEVDLKQSAGPATCIIAGIDPEDIERIKELVAPLPVTLVGGLD